MTSRILFYSILALTLSLVLTVLSGHFFGIDPNIDRIEPKTPECCVNIIDKLLTKGLSKRYKTAAQVVNYLNACLDGLN